MHLATLNWRYPTEQGIVVNFSAEQVALQEDESDDESTDETYNRPTKLETLNALQLIKHFFQCDKRDVTSEIDKITDFLKK
jgi:hypothetical protein